MNAAVPSKSAYLIALGGEGGGLQLQSRGASHLSLEGVELHGTLRNERRAGGLFVRCYEVFRDRLRDAMVHVIKNGIGVPLFRSHSFESQAANTTVIYTNVSTVIDCTGIRRVYSKPQGNFRPSAFRLSAQKKWLFLLRLHCSTKSKRKFTHQAHTFRRPLHIVFLALARVEKLSTAPPIRKDEKNPEPRQQKENGTKAVLRQENVSYPTRLLDLFPSRTCGVDVGRPHVSSQAGAELAKAL